MSTASWLALFLGVLALAAAIQAGNDLTIAVPAGAVGVALVALVGVVEVRSRTSQLWRVRGTVLVRLPPDRPTSDSLLQLRKSFRAGIIGRSSILATLRGLERDLAPTGRTLLSLEEERAILDLPPEPFRRWVEERIRRIEAAT